MPHRAVRGESGSVLVEALVATALLGVALIAMTATLSTLAVAGRTAQNQATAQAAGRAAIAQIKAAPYVANGNYSQFITPVPDLNVPTIDVKWWNSAYSGACAAPPVTGTDPCWTSTPNDQGIQLITVTYGTNSAPMLASLQFVKAAR